ncbi:MAG: RnfABCDGE type electron transport complex subunit G [Clostridiales bacterium]|nr:RnfABCDGE type electron transport complex subunit G [Clostridiales bacterium]
MRRAQSTPFNMVGAVLLTCVVAATSLALTYEVTRDRIAAQERAAEERALRAVVPDAEGFEVADDVLEQSVDAAQEIAVTAVYRALGPEGNVVAWGVRVAPRGYAGPIQLVVGLDRDGEVLGVSIISMTETPGLGTKIATVDGWLDQFIGWSGADINASAREFDAIAGATKSSVAVREGVVAAGRVWSAALSGREEVDAP